MDSSTLSKRVLITGATSHLGCALIDALTQVGNFKFILHGRTPAKLQVLRERYADSIDSTIAFDVLDKAADLFFEHDDWEVPDIIIHAVGGGVTGDGHPLSMEVLEQAMKLNCHLPAYLSEQAILNWMSANQKKRKPLTIVNISSAATQLGNSAPAYVMAKAALEAWTKNLAGFYTDPRLSIFAVQPGPLLSGHWQQAQQQQTEAYLKKLQLRQDRPFPKVEETTEQIVSMILHQPQLFHGQVVNMSGSLLT